MFAQLHWRQPINHLRLTVPMPQAWQTPDCPYRRAIGSGVVFQDKAALTRRGRVTNLHHVVYGYALTERGSCHAALRLPKYFEKQEKKYRIRL
jgi:hypothetical protein